MWLSETNYWVSVKDRQESVAEQDLISIWWYTYLQSVSQNRHSTFRAFALLLILLLLLLVLTVLFTRTNEPVQVSG